MNITTLCTVSTIRLTLVPAREYFMMCAIKLPKTDELETQPIKQILLDLH